MNSLDAITGIFAVTLRHFCHFLDTQLWALALLNAPMILPSQP